MPEARDEDPDPPGAGEASEKEEEVDFEDWENPQGGAYDEAEQYAEGEYEPLGYQFHESQPNAKPRGRVW